MNDQEAYDLYPNDNWVYDKTNIADAYNVQYGCLIPDNRTYVVKPYINLLGCSIGSKIVSNLKGFTVPPDTRWFEYLVGVQWTVDYHRLENGSGWEIRNFFIGHRNKKDHTKFDKWEKVVFGDDEQSWMINNAAFHNPIINLIKDAPVVNFEFIGDKAIEVHLRGNTDPVEHDMFMPVWHEPLPSEIRRMNDEGFTFIEDEQDHPGRFGFWVRTKNEV